MAGTTNSYEPSMMSPTETVFDDSSSMAPTLHNSDDASIGAHPGKRSIGETIKDMFSVNHGSHGGNGVDQHNPFPDVESRSIEIYNYNENPV